MPPKVILLVDDNPDDRELALLAFEAIGIADQIKVVCDGLEALDYLFGRGEFGDRARHPFPSIMLLDLKLPRLSGLDVLKQLRSHSATQFLPVVVLTTSTEDRDLVESYSLGCNSYIRKPVDFEQFQESVRQMGLYWLLLNQVPPTPPS